MMIAGLIAGWNGYALHEGFAQPCIVFETDIGGAFYTMAGMGWLMLISLLFPGGRITGAGMGGRIADRPEHVAAPEVSAQQSGGEDANGRFPEIPHARPYAAMEPARCENPGKGLGCLGDYGNWVWFDRWIDPVRQHCEAEGEKFR